MSIAKPGTAIIGAAITALLLSACGGPTEADPEFLEQSPRAITRTAFAQMRELTSVRILGTVASAGGPARIDVRADDEGRCSGSLDLERGRVQFIHTEGTTWLKGDDDFWQARAQSPQMARRIQGDLGTSWAEVPSRLADLEGVCGVAPMLAGFKARKDGGDGRLSKGDVELIGDTQAVAISERGGGQSSTVWVSVASPHRVVKIVSREAKHPTTVSFEEFGVEVDAEAPAEEDVVDLSAYALRRTR